jgi:hypothetical protein
MDKFLSIKKINEIHLTVHQDLLDLNGKWEALEMGRSNESLKKRKSLLRVIFSQFRANKT